MINDKVRLKKAKQVTLIGSIINFFLILLKIGAGIMGRSQAMIADAVHSISDFISDVIVVISLQLAHKPKDRCHEYGHGKYETLAALLISLSLFLIAIGILYQAARTLHQTYHGYQIVKPRLITLWVAGLSIFFKELIFHFTLKTGRKINSQTIIANAWHHRSDSLSSLAAFLGISGAIFLGENWRILDPIAAIIVSIIIFKTAVSILKKSLNELLESSLPDEIESQIMHIVSAVPGVHHPHNLKTRSLGKDIVIDVHIEVDKNMSVEKSHLITIEIEERLKACYGVATIISIHVEPLRD